MTEHNPEDNDPETPTVFVKPRLIGYDAVGLGILYGYNAWGLTPRSASLKVLRRYNRNIGKHTNPEGPHQCEGCGRNYAEYVNGCVEDHPAPRKVVAVPTPPDV